MTADMTVFLVLGTVGVVLLLASLLLGDLFEGLVGWLDGIDLDVDGGWFSLPVLAAFLSAFGFGGALASSATDGNVAAGLVGGAAAGLLLGYLAWRLSRALMGMATDATPTASHLVGKPGKVVTPVAGNRLGEVLVRSGGQPVKVSARSRADLATGEAVVVVEVVSPTSVVVESATEFWSTSNELPETGEEREQ